MATRDRNGRWTHTRGKPPGCGRLQRAIRRTFIAYGFRSLTIRILVAMLSGGSPVCALDA